MGNEEDVKQILDRWRNPRAKRQEESIDLVLKVLEAKGFEVRFGGKNHYVASHDKLTGAPFGLRRLTISAHSHGQPGIVPKTAINNILLAIELIEEHE